MDRRDGGALALLVLALFLGSAAGQGLQINITQQPEDIITTDRTAVSFTCVAEGDSISYRWERLDTEGNVTNTMVGNASVLRFSPAMFGDEGFYRCVAFNDITSAVSNTATLTISPENSVDVLPGSRIQINFVFGSIRTFECTALGGPGNMFQWFKDDEVLQNETSNTLTITVTSSQDGGTYRCQVSNAAGNGSDTATLIIRPAIIQQPTDVTTLNGTNVSFTCEAVGFPLPTYQWEREEAGVFTEVPGATNMTLEFTPAVFGDEGRYRCVASVSGILFGGGDAFSIPAVLTISAPIEITQQPDNIATTDGTAVSFTCVAEGDNNISYQWERLDAEGNVTNVMVGNASVLEFSPVMFGDEGFYRCVAFNDITSAVSNTATLTISPEGTVIVTPGSLQLNFVFGSTQIFECTAQGGPGNMFQWFRNGEVLQNETSNTLTITVTSSEDGGTYRCQVSNAAGSGSDTAEVTIRPAIIQQPMNVTTTNGMNVNFTCEAVGFPLPTYQWEKGEVQNGEVVPGEFTAIPGATNMILEFTPVVFGDEGEYRCVASVSGILFGGGDAFSDTAVLTISPEGTVNVTPGSVQLNFVFGSTQTFECTAQGGPGNMFQWFKDDEVLQNETSSTLNITITSSQDGGTYRCQVSNAAGNGSDTAEVTIRPAITRQPMNITTTNGTNVNFTCEAVGFPLPTYQWERETEAGMFTEVPGATDMTLKFTPVVFGDEGQYRCVASVSGILFGGGDAFSDTALLTISPENSVDVDPNILPVLGSVQTLDCMAQGGPDNMFQWFNNDVILQNETSNTLDVSVSENEVGDTYRCQVSNAAGTGSDTATVRNPAITQQPTDVSTTNGTNISFTCNAVGFPELTYQWERETDIGIFTEVPGATDMILDFTPAMFGDEGRYRCVASANNSEAVSSAALLTISPEGSVDVNPATLQLSLGNQTTLNCTALGGPGNMFQWFRNEEILQNETSNTLTITISSSEDGGIYRCQVSNAAGNGSDTAEVNIRPAIIQQPMNVTTTNGMNINFTCKAVGFPLPTYQWERETEAGVFTEVFGATDMTLDLSPAMFGDEGRYRCIASVSGISSEAESATAVLTISPESSVRVNPEFFVGTIGEDASFSCMAEGGPGNTFQWSRNDSILQNETSDTLNITAISVAQDGGTYRCQVSNAAGNGSNASTLFIRPEIIQQPMNVTTTNGTNVSFTCLADSFPTAEYQWERESEQDVYTEVPGATDVTLEMTPAVFGDEGRYRCVANVSGIPFEAVSDTALLTISPENSVDVSPDLLELSFENQTTLNCIALGGPGNMFQWFRNDEVLQNGTSNTLSITVSSSQDGGTYRCQVSNAAGNGSDTAEVTIRPAITRQPMNVTTTNGTNVSFTCAAVGFPLPTYQWERETEAGVFTEVPGATNMTLDFTPALFGDEGRYRCVANVSGMPFEAESNVAVLTISPEGSVDVNPDTSQLSLENQTTLNCTALGGPGNMFQWFRNEEILQNEISNTLNIIISSSQDGGIYRCLVSNAAGSGSDTAVVNIYPAITRQPMNVTTTNGMNVSFTCEAVGFPLPTYRWERETDAGVFTEVFGATDMTLDFTPAIFGDEGRYHCIASVSGISSEAESATAVLTISPESSVRVNPGFFVGTIGGDASFSCMAEGGPGNTFQWFRNDSILQNEISDTLNITAISVAQDGGTYRCRVSNAAGNSFSTSTLFIRPAIIRQPMNVNTINGANVSFTCLADSFPTADYQWERETEQGAFIAVTGATDMKLELIPAVFGDEGRYRCIASVSTPANTSEVQSTAAILTISPEGSVTTFPEIVLSNRNEVVNFTCMAEGGPNNTFTWTRLDVVGTDPVLQIIVASAMDGDVYQCSVENNAGSESSSVLLNVSPEILIPPMSLNVTIAEEPIVLTCQATGFPPPTISWSHNGTTVVSDGRVNITLDPPQRTLTGSTLMVQAADVIVNDSGQYECIATTQIPEFPVAVAASGPVTVLIQDVPERPQNVTGVAINSTAVRLTWTEPRDNNAPITGYTIRYQLPQFEGGNEIMKTIPPEPEEAVILDLHPGVTYTFTVRAFNDIGSGNPSDPAVVRTLDEPPTSSPQNVMVTAASSTALFISWEPVPESDQNGLIVTYEVLYEPRETFDGQIGPLSVNTTDGSFLSITLTDLQEYVAYNVSVRAYTSAGEGPFSTEAATRTMEDVPSAPPDNVTATAENSTSIRVNWEEVPAIDQNGIITQYEVMYEPLETFGGQISTQLINTTNTSILLQSLQEYVEYSITVRAYTSVGEGPFSLAENVRTLEYVPSAPPDNVVATAESSTSIRVNWEEVPAIDQNGIITQYEVMYEPLETFGGQISTQTMTINNASIFEVVLNNLEESVEYNITVRAYTLVGEGPFSPVVTVRTLEDVPSAPPDNVTATAESSTSIRVNWEEVPAIDQNGIITQYEVMYEPLETFGEQISTQTINTMDASIFEVLLQNLQEYVEYNITVRAYTSVGEGPFSPVVTVRTLEDVPSLPPDNVVATAENSTSIRVNWEEVPAIDQNGIITQYEVMYEPLETFGGQISTQLINTTNTSILLQNLQEFVEYSITVRAYTLVGEGPFSPVVTIRTLEDVPSAPPDNVVATAVSSTSIRVSWEEVPAIDQNGIITQYEVMYEPLETFDGQISTQTMTTNDASIFEVVLNNLQEYVEYSITVRAYTSMGEGPFSSAETDRTREDAPSGFPLNIRATTLSPTMIRVDWDTVEEIDRNGIITHYEVQFTQTTFPEIAMTNTENTTDNSLTLILMGLEEYVEYTVTVRAYTAAGVGPYNTLSASSRTDEDAPVATPRNVMVLNITDSSTELRVNWQRPEEIDINGVLVNYVIRYSIAGGGDTNSTVMVPANSLTVLLDGLENFTTYNVYVAALTVADGPSAVGSERTSENVPGAPPQDVRVMTESSTTISVRWNPPPQALLYGIPRGYQIRYTPLFPNESARIAQFQNVPYENTFILLESLEEFTNYSIEVAAVTIGPGVYSDPLVTQTDQDLPGVVSRPPEIPESNISPTSVRVIWSPPSDPNGVIIQYTVNVVALGTRPLPGRKRQLQEANLLENCVIGGADNINRNLSFSGDTTSEELQNLTPFTDYEFSVQAETSVGPGPFSPPRAFSTSESTPTEPRNLVITVQSSTQLDVSWNHPLCDYGNRTQYTIVHEPQPGPYEPLGGYGTPQGAMMGSQANYVFTADTNSLSITGLTPFTNYSITVSASTSAGMGELSNEVQQTEEDVPGPVTNLVLTSNTIRDGSNQDEVQVPLSWNAPSPRNGPYRLLLSYTARQTLPYPPERMKTDSDTLILRQETQGYTIGGALPFANYSVTIHAVNIKLGLEGIVDSSSIRSNAIRPSAVTNLRAVATSFSSIRVDWSLPENPNSKIIRYEVYYRASDTAQDPPTSDPATDNRYQTMLVTEIPVDNVSPQTTANIENLIAFTNYTFQVRAIGTDGVGPGELSGEIEIEILQRTNSTVPTEPPTTNPVTVSPPPGPSSSTVFIFLPPPDQIVTGIPIFYAVVVVKGEGRSTDMETYLSAGPYVKDATFYITAAWDETSIGRVPDSLLVGDESITVANNMLYENVRLDSNSNYSFFVRIDIQSDNGMRLTTYSDYVSVRTALPFSPAGVAVGVIIAIGVITAVVVVAIILFIYWKRTHTGVFKKQNQVFQSPNIGEVAALEDSNIVGVYSNPLAEMKHDGTHHPVPVNKFVFHVQKLHGNDDFLFSEEYKAVEPEHSPTVEATRRPCNTSKNRYANITAYDQHRVRLQEISGVPGSDYINACHIDGYRQPNGFIAAQGPVPASVPDFWRMIWEQGTATIVMLTNLEEKGRVKCHQYWPEEKVGLYDLLRVHLQEVVVLAEYTVRTFSLQKDGSKEERIVTQYHFTVWPDHGVPEHPTPLLHFVRKVATSNPRNSGPIVVHCSAGVGRTGTFITLHAQLRRIKAENNLDVFGFVRAMRYRRCFMVQTEPQYIFIHDALLEAIECGETEVPARELREQHRRLGFKDSSGDTQFFIEFEKLETTIHHHPFISSGTMPINKSKNRYTVTELLPYEKSRCRLSAIPGVAGSDYINASYIDGYHKLRGFIATQGPLPDTTDDFWRMVWENSSATIVMLTKEREEGRVRCHRYWPESSAETYSTFQVIRHSSTDYPDYTLREFNVIDTRDQSSLQVKQFHYTGWPEDGIPESGAGFIDLIGQVQKWQRNSGDRPIIVHCSGGCGRTGTFIAINILIERLKTEGVVDVFHTVRGLRLQRPGMVSSVEQYEFCYKTVLEYLDSFELYDNFK